MNIIDKNLATALCGVIKNVLNSLGYNVAEVAITDKSTKDFRIACFETSEIVTAPMMFARIKAHGNIRLSEHHNDGEFKGHITLNISYETFSGGGNGTELGHIDFNLYETKKGGYLRGIQFIRDFPSYRY